MAQMKMRPKMPSLCIDCIHYGDLGARRGSGYERYCTMNHKPRFMKPRHPLDTDWGFKRTCHDFMEAKEDEDASAQG